VLLFYDDPDQPEDIFDDFLSLPFEIKIIESSLSFLEFINLLPASDPLAGTRSVLSPPTLPSQGKLNIV
jgi:hypothetical protein